MAGLKHKLKGTTLIETLVAMILLVTTISLSFLSITSIRKSFNNEIKTNAFLMATKLIQESDSMSIESLIKEYPPFNIYINKKQYSSNPNLYIITASAVTKTGTVLCELTEIKRSNSPEIITRKTDDKEGK